MSLPFTRFLEASGGRMLADAHRLPLQFVPNTDSRALASGESFVCLRGPNFDGHDYIDRAVEQGAVAIVVDDAAKVPPDLRIPVIRVSDAKAAYLAGAAASRKAFSGQVIGVTGSSGKTTTKEFTAQIVSSRRRVLATPQNENNELGVAKICYRLNSEVDVAVIEFGARHPGEIAELVNIASPDIGILTNVGEAHLEFFPDQAELARTKFALFSKGARAVCTAADMWSRMLSAQAGQESSTLWVRLVGDQVMSGIMLEAGSPKDGHVAVTMGASAAFANWKLVGEHHLRDALLAAGAAILAGLTFEDALAQFGNLRLPPGRFEIHRGRAGATIVYDAYNANPSSMTNALDSFVQIQAERHIAVLGSMAELGQQSEAHHRSVGAAAARSGIDVLYVGGPLRAALAQGAREAGLAADRINEYSGNAQAAEMLSQMLALGDCVLLKGSRAEKMEEILERLVAAGALAS
jgi:UDP-N-acetylmuramoyl-tripeptide--D-alanyl-D-alanine ligase